MAERRGGSGCAKKKTAPRQPLGAVLQPPEQTQTHTGRPPLADDVLSHAVDSQNRWRQKTFDESVLLRKSSRRRGQDSYMQLRSTSVTLAGVVSPVVALVDVS